jgi:uncharacterized membrane protein
MIIVKYRIKLFILNYFIEFVGIMCLLFLIIHPVIIYNKVPKTIPVHFNIWSKTDRCGDKITISFLPAIGLII